jgi:hypothetical protein
MSIVVQQGATIYSLFIPVNWSTCFGWYLHPSSGAHITVSTASGISVTVQQPVVNVDGLEAIHVNDSLLYGHTNKLYIAAPCSTVIDIYS